MDDFSFNLACLDSDDAERQLAGLAFFAACDDSLLTDEAIKKLIYLTENAQKHIAVIATSIISQATVNREKETVVEQVLKKLKSGKDIALRDLEWAVSTKSAVMKKALERYLDGCSEPKHISWLVKNLPQTYPDPQQIPLLKSFLTYGDDRIVSNTIEGLEYLNEPELLAVFVHMLNHASHRVRSVAAGAISRANPEKARNILFSMLQQPKKIEAIKAACHAIKHVAGSDFLDLIMPLLNNKNTRNEAAKTTAWIAFQQINRIFDHEVFKNQGEIKASVAAAIIELLREQCHKSSCFQANDNKDNADKLTIGEQTIIVFNPLISRAEAKILAEENKHRTLNFFSRIIYRPQDDEIILTDSEARMQPFWQIEFDARIDYEREKPLKMDFAKDVREIKIGDQYFKTKNGKLNITIDERCSVREEQEKFIDAISGEETDLADLWQHDFRKIGSITELSGGDFKISSARVKASTAVKTLFIALLKPLKASEIINQSLKLVKLNLCFRPVYIFAYTWKDREQSVVLAIDGVTGKIAEGASISSSEKESDKISEADLFKIDADGISITAPGDEVAAKIAMAFFGKKK